VPEGHTVHRLAAEYARLLGGRPVRVSSPQGPFAASAALLDGSVLEHTEAHGKHLFLGFPGERSLHIHLGLYGKVQLAPGPAPAPVGQVRLRLEGEAGFADLRGPHRCELLSEAGKKEIQDRLGPDPLRADADPNLAWRRISASGRTIAALLMEQQVLAGAGNVYRAEVLFRQGIDPLRRGRDLSGEEWDAIWHDLVQLMREGVRLGRIDTVRPEHTPEAMGRPPRVDDHGGEVYVYRRAGLPCHVCGGPVSAAEHAARNLFWCPTCQSGSDRRRWAADRHGRAR
jgi:endonuclease-8